MKIFARQNTQFSLCGLNCALCPMQLGGHCPGCGGGAGNQACALARCSLEHGGIEYCFQCAQYPCQHFVCSGAGFPIEDEYDSFITHAHRVQDMQKAQLVGISAYMADLHEKVRFLRILLDTWNDGRKKTLFCVAANLLDGEDARSIIQHLDKAAKIPIKERAALATNLLKEAAAAKGLELVLRKKSSGKKRE